jgi:F0F1-type ATP synthase membrane subunit a
MMSGHILMKILIGFVWSIFSVGSIWLILSFVPFAIIFCVTGLEFVIAFLQAYVFIVLLAIYLNDVINVH